MTDGLQCDFFWIVTVQHGTKTSVAIAVFPSKTFNCFACFGYS